MNKLWFGCFEVLLLAGLLNLNLARQGNEDDKTYNKTYTVGVIPGIDDFLTMNAEDKKMETLYNESDQNSSNRRGSTKDSKIEFKNNRARVLMHDYENGKLDEGDTEITFTPVPSYCFVDHDTLLISMGISWTAGYAFDIKVFGDQFQSSYFIHADGNEKGYKASLRSPAVNQLSINNKFQSLILDKKPSFKPGEQISGYLTYTTGTFYEKNEENKYDEQYASGKVYFTCTVRGK